MRLFSVGDLMTRCRQQADMEGSEFVTDTELKSYMTTIYGQMYGEIVKAGMRHFEDVHTVSTDGSASYALPKDFMWALGVDYVVDSGGRRRRLRELMAQERNQFKGTTGNGTAVAYSIVGSGATPLELYPTPNSGQSYELVYVPHPQDITKLLDTATIDVVTPDGESFLIYGVACEMLAKEDSDVTYCMSKFEQARARLIEDATLRAFNQPRRVIVEQTLGNYDNTGRWWSGEDW